MWNQGTWSVSRARRRRVAGSGVVLAWFAAGALACGPDFPNSMLDAGDAALFRVPEARFQKELERMKLVSCPHAARPVLDQARQTFDADLSDLRAALRAGGLSPWAAEQGVERHRVERAKVLAQALSVKFSWREPERTSTAQPGLYNLPCDTNGLPAVVPVPDVVSGLPGEFADYFCGAIAWHRGVTNEARGAWMQLLARPAAERHYRSTWAAFMLGRSWSDEHPGQAAAYYQQTRALARAGFADSLGLAAASLGWEAQLRFRAREFVPAIDLYLEQFASGDPSALVSLRWAAAAALRAPDKVLRQLAAHPRAQRVITAFVLSGGWREEPFDRDGPFKEAMLGAWTAASTRFSFLPAPADDWHRVEAPAARWLEAVGEAGVTDVLAAEQLAMAAYQGGDWERAARWLEHAPSTPVGQWLRAKLLLRDGRTREASALLSLLVRRYPGGVDGGSEAVPPGLAGSLYLPNSEYLPPLTLAQQWNAELGVFRLSRRQYLEALDAFMHSAHWNDAAYVADQVLTVDELKGVVDRRWPEPAPPPGPGNRTPEQAGDDARAETLCMVRSLRHLLARRLSRAGRAEEARAYYPAELRAGHDRLQAALRRGRETQAPALERGRALFEAARLTRHQGLQLIGTELDPDWRVHDGQFANGVMARMRAELQSSNLLVATGEELERAARHGVEPDLRWHYRYQAAELAWEAARLLPDNHDLTARVLCVGGTWLKNVAPDEADRFYKALVRRCRKTVLGKEADRLRWFPRVDGEGNPLGVSE